MTEADWLGMVQTEREAGGARFRGRTPKESVLIGRRYLGKASAMVFLSNFGNRRLWR